MLRRILISTLIIATVYHGADAAGAVLARVDHTGAVSEICSAASLVRTASSPLTTNQTQTADQSRLLEAPSSADMTAWLASVEKTIGITPAQGSAWRNYAAALEALLTPSEPDFYEIKWHKQDELIDPFLRDLWLAEVFRSRAKAADRLTSAILILQDTLTPEQKAKLASVYGFR